jgi:selenide,water dikinase
MLRELADPSRVAVALVGDARGLLPQLAARAGRLAERRLRARGVALHLGQRVIRCDAGGLELADGRRVEADAVVWATGSAAPRWLAATGLACDADGYVAVDDTLRSLSHPAIFAAGDCASMVAHPRPRSGVIAVRQGPPLARNLAAVLAGGKPTPFVPQRQALAILATGGRRAIATRGGWAIEGGWVWRWKDHLDRAFMARYRLTDA